MFVIRDIQLNDLPDVYTLTVKLLRHHIGQNAESCLTESELYELFQNGFLKGLLLVRTPILLENSNATRLNESTVPVGFMIFHADISLLRGGQGICLDQFYIEPGYRKQGLGRRMMAVLCRRVLASNGNYIKLVFQDGLGLDSVYGKMGFVNHSKGDACVHLFESYGKEKLQEFIDRVDRTKSESASPSKTHILAMPFVQGPTDVNAILPQWSVLSSSSSQHSELPSTALPGARLIIVAESGLCPSPDSVPDTGLLTRFHSRLCMFIEQPCICCWLGPMVNFADFVGDTSVLTPRIFLKQIRAWTERSPRVSGAVWEVPTQACNVQSSSSDQKELAEQLHDLDVPDDTSIEGWNIAYLDVAGMQKLASSGVDSEDFLQE